MAASVNIYVEHGELTARYILPATEEGADIRQRYDKLIEEAARDLMLQQEQKANLRLAEKRASDGRSVLLSPAALATLKDGDTVQLVHLKSPQPPSVTHSQSSPNRTSPNTNALKRAAIAENTQDKDKRQKTNATATFNPRTSNALLGNSNQNAAAVAGPGPATIAAAQGSRKTAQNSVVIEAGLVKNGNPQNKPQSKERTVVIGRGPKREDAASRPRQIGDGLPTFIWCQHYPVEGARDLKPTNTVRDLKLHLISVERYQKPPDFDYLEGADDVWVCVEDGELTRDEDNLGLYFGKTLVIEFRRVGTSVKLCTVEVRIPGQNNNSVQINEIKPAHDIEPRVFSLFDQLMAIDPRVDPRRHALWYSDSTGDNKPMKLDSFLAEWPFRRNDAEFTLRITRAKLQL